MCVLHSWLTESVMDVRISQSHANLHFPGICWLFGKQLHERLQYPPIGLVSVTYSDSIMEEWVPSRVNEKCGIAYSDRSASILRIYWWWRRWWWLDSLMSLFLFEEE